MCSGEPAQGVEVSQLVPFLIHWRLQEECLAVE
jgi:hypothetical protein